MNTNQIDVERRLITAIISSFSGGTPSRSEVENRSESMASLFGYQGTLSSVIEEVQARIDMRMGEGVSLVDVSAEHDVEWALKREDITEWTYFDDYKRFLGERTGWHTTLITKLEIVVGKIIGHLQDPISEGVWRRCGLVIGHVQSGKTANYTGVIAMAADAGYKFIIIIAGLHNNLRQQTQERIDEGFVGRSSDVRNRGEAIGVGELNREHPSPVTLTTTHDDFNRQTAATLGGGLNDFSKPIILVIKKNVSTLKSLHTWLVTQNAKDKMSNVPVLVIDDEADHASVNTNKPDIDPTKTNELIREIINLFSKSCYVGYTATPFANIFINPEFEEDLFPKDFIYCLDAPSEYFGPDKVFLDDDNDGLYLDYIEDGEDYIPMQHKKNDSIKELPPSLYEAIDRFFIIRAIRNLRGHQHRHCSMMVHVSRFVNIQSQVKTMIYEYTKRLREAIQANYAMPDNISEQNAFISGLKKAYNKYYMNSGYTWDEIKSNLNEAGESLRIFLINSQSDEALSYRRHEQDGNSLTAIAVGGISLSRGLTIEGLCVSYMYRNTRQYDTLMQMGRWFGYRTGYEDLCTVYLSRDSINWYTHIAEASEELRQQIGIMRSSQRSPRDFGLYVRAHPDRLLITSANKMRSGEQRRIRINFGGRLVESYLLPTDMQVNKANEELIKEYWRKKFCDSDENPESRMQKTKKGWVFYDVSIQVIEEFITRFQMHPGFEEKRQAIISYIQKFSSQYQNGGDVLLISLRPRQEDADSYTLNPQERISSEKVNDGSAWKLSKDRAASRSDEKLGLSDQQIEEAWDRAEKEPSDCHFREIRNKPLLMLHIFNVEEDESLRVPAFGISFPGAGSGNEVEIKFVVNQVWIDSNMPYAILEQEGDYEE